MAIVATVYLRNYISKHNLATILVVGAIIRLVLMPITAHPFDVYVWYSMSQSIVSSGVLSVDAFPPFHLMLVPSAYLYSWLASFLPSSVISMSSLPAALDFYPTFNVPVVPGLLFNFVVKIPFLVSDVLITFFLYKFVYRILNNKGFAQKAALLWFLNPFVIWISAGWGMWDTLAVLFSLMTFYFLLKKKFVFSAVCLSLGVALKFYPILFLVPIGIYLFRKVTAEFRWSVILRFFGVFIGSIGLILLPFIGVLPTFLRNFLFPSSISVTSMVADPVVHPLGFGLTYWSTCLLGRLVNAELSSGFIYGASLFSTLFAAGSILVVYWRSSKFDFKKTSFNLSLMMFLTLALLFLSLRFVCEQWFLWILPFFIVLCVSGRIKSYYYWGASCVALLYAMLNCPFPFFFLPLTPWIEQILLGSVNALWSVEPLRIIALIVLGCLFSIFIILSIISVFRHARSENSICLH